MVNNEGGRKRWSFPPVLDQFDLMETDTDPAELENIFTDERYVERTRPAMYCFFVVVVFKWLIDSIYVPIYVPDDFSENSIR